MTRDRSDAKLGPVPINKQTREIANESATVRVVDHDNLVGRFDCVGMRKEGAATATAAARASRGATAATATTATTTASTSTSTRAAASADRGGSLLKEDGGGVERGDAAG